MNAFHSANKKRRLSVWAFGLLCLLLVLVLLALPVSAAAAPAGDGSAGNPFTDAENDRLNFPVYPEDSAVSLARNVILADGAPGDDSLYAKVTLQVMSMQPSANEPTQMYLLIDCSFSMSLGAGNGESRMAVVKSAASSFAQTLLADPARNISIGIIAFGDGGRVVRAPTNKLNEIEASIAGLTANASTTKMSQALNLATDGLRNADGGRYIVALTDGEIVTDDQANTQNAARAAGDAKINIFTIGFTHTSTFLESLKAGNGSYQSALNADSLPNVFGTILTRLLTPNTEGVVTDSIAPQFELLPSSEQHPWELSLDGATETDPAAVAAQDGNTLVWTLGSLPADATFSFYIRLLPSAAAGASLPVSDAATLLYNNYLDQYCQLSFPNAEVLVPLSAISPASSTGPTSGSSSAAASSAVSSSGTEGAAAAAADATPPPQGNLTIMNTGSSHEITIDSGFLSAASGSAASSTSLQLPVPIPPDNRTPMAPPKTMGWSFVNLLLAFTSALLSCILFVSLFSRKNLETQPVQRIRPPWKVLAVLLGLASVAVLFATQDFTLPIVAVDAWSLWGFVILVGQLLSMLIGYATHGVVYE